MRKKIIKCKSPRRILKNRMCVVCGKRFNVELKPGNVIPRKYFYSDTLGESLSGKKDIEYWECEKCSKG